jgi:hypothetical protein
VKANGWLPTVRRNVAIASIFRVEKYITSIFRAVFYPEDGSYAFVRNVDNILP